MVGDQDCMVGSVSWMGCPQAIETDCACAVGTEACSAADMKSNKMITKNDRRKNSFIEPLERIALFKSNLAGPVTPLTDLLETGQLQGCCLVGLIFQFFQFVRNAILLWVTLLMKTAALPLARVVPAKGIGTGKAAL